ncbi:MAG TPA: hypothetical protein VEA19_05830 [Actinomycetota bacterium]|nr:hypothetical protein [Actinomycetota bacterium]
MKRVLSPLAGVALAASVAFVGPLGAAPGNKYSNDVARPTFDCPDADGEIDFTGPLKMWPPNHKYQPFTTTATADDPDAEVTLDVAGMHDEMVSDTEEMNGAGNTDPATDVSPNPGEAMDTMGAMDDDGDGNGIAKVVQQARSERSGQGDGRTYTISVLATFAGQPCQVDAEGQEVAVTYTMDVPHDMRGGADWKK